ncbi:quinone oxidoreductase family protein [Natrarchaeobius halalkaliphilus]|nr:NADPH:quinone reductase [Natrarchaeobius halalkaliphilus]
MRAITYHETGGPDVLQVEEKTKPEPASDEVLVRVEATSVNQIDTLFRSGVDMFVPDQFPAVAGVDMAGVVEEIGSEVEGFTIGDRVLGAEFPGPTGANAEYVASSPAFLAPLPEEVSFEAGAGIGHVGITSWRSLVDHAALEPKETCLIHGGGGGLGPIAVQLADRIGGRVVTTSSSPDRRDELERLGAEVALDYRRDDLQEAFLEAAPGKANVIIDGHLNNYFEFDLEVLARFGRIVCIEFTGDEGGEASFSQFHTRLGNWKEARLHWVGAPNAPDVSDVLGRLAALVASGDVEVPIAKTYSFDEAADAHQAMIDSDYFGKLILEP